MASAKTYDQIAWTSLGSAAASITFSSIAASWTDLRLVIGNLTTSSATYPYIQYNGDTATNYSWRQLNGNGSSAASVAAQNVTKFTFLNNGASSTTIPATITVDIFSYADTGKYKTSLVNEAADTNGSGYIQTEIFLWRSTSAINSILISGGGTYNFNTGTTAALYGIKAA